MITRKSFTDAIIVAMSWFIGYWITRFFGQGAEAVIGYAIIGGWWFTAYISAKLVLHISLVIPLFFGYFLLFTIAGITGEASFYRDIYSLSFNNISFSVFLFFLGINLAQSFFICSPVIFDWLFRKIISVWPKK